LAAGFLASGAIAFDVTAAFFAAELRCETGFIGVGSYQNVGDERVDMSK